jgi:acetyl-CoA C-acetyltransferase
MAATTSYILGGAQTDFLTDYTAEKKGMADLFREITELGFAATNLDYGAIEELKKENKVEIFVGNFAGELFLNQGHLGPFLTTVDPVFVGIPAGRYEAACASSSLAVSVANSRIKAKEIDLAIIVGAEIMRNVSPLEANENLATCSDYVSEGEGVRFFYPRMFGYLTEEVLRRYGSISEDKLKSHFLEISLKNRGNARRNKNAQLRNENLNVAELEVLNRKYKSVFGGQTRFSDCSQISDGAAILFLASAEYADKYLKKTGKKLSDIAALSGIGFRVAELSFAEKTKSSSGSKYILPWAKQTVQDAFFRARVTIDDIDMIELHDCFSVNEYIAISNFGITEPEQEYIAIEEGVTQMGGKIPINPSGGLMGAGHPVGASGARMLLDIFKQVTGTAGEYQVEGAKRGATFNVGGSCTTTMSLVLSNAALEG